MTTRRQWGGMLLAAALVALLAFPALAKGNKAQRLNNGHGKITAVSATSITVLPKKGKGAGEAKTFTVTPSTTVLLDGQSAAPTALTIGQHAKVKSADGTTALEIDARTHGKKKTL